MQPLLTRRQLVLLMAACTVAIVACVLICLPFFTGFSLFGTSAAADVGSGSSSSPSASSTTASTDCTTHVHYYASSSDKQTSYDFGPAFTKDNGEWTKSSILSQLNTRLCKGDPALTSAVFTYMMTGDNPDYTTLDATTVSYVDSRGDWKDDISSLMAKLRKASFTTETVPAGSWSLYMQKNADGTYDILQGQTVTEGTAAVFTTDDGTFMFRLDCGFQPVATEKFPGVPEIPQPSSSPSSTSSATSTSTPTSHPHPKPSHTTEAKIASSDPAAQGHAKTGGGKNADPGPGTYVPPSDAPKPPSTPRTNPSPPPSDSGSSGRSGSSGSSGSGSGSSSSPSPSPTRSTPAPEQSAPTPSGAPSQCAPAPGSTC